MKKLKLIRREISNYFFLRRTLSKEKQNLSPDHPWNMFNLRMNWYGRVYTVISLREQDMGEELMVQNWKAMEMMRPMNEYLTSLGLQEIIFPSIEKIPESRSYLIVYSPLFKELSIKWVLRKFILVILFSLAIFLIFKML